MNQIQIKKVSFKQYCHLNLHGIFFEETFSKSGCAENFQKGEEFSKKKLSYDYKYKSSEYYFASYQNEVLGYLLVNQSELQTKIKKSCALEIEQICLFGETQEKKTIGIMLYDKAIKIAKQKNIEYVWVGIFSDNPGAICYYRKNGFQEFDKNIVKSDDGEKAYILMKRKVCAGPALINGE